MIILGRQVNNGETNCGGHSYVLAYLSRYSKGGFGEN